MESYNAGGYFVGKKTFRIKNIFLEFLEALGPKEMLGSRYRRQRLKSSAMIIDFSHVMRFNDSLQKAISDKLSRLRELTRSEVGKLVSVTGAVTQINDVRPELL